MAKLTIAAALQRTSGDSDHDPIGSFLCSNCMPRIKEYCHGTSPPVQTMTRGFEPPPELNHQGIQVMYWGQIRQMPIGNILRSNAR